MGGAGSNPVTAAEYMSNGFLTAHESVEQWRLIGRCIARHRKQMTQNIPRIAPSTTHSTLLLRAIYEEQTRRYNFRRRDRL